MSALLRWFVRGLDAGIREDAFEPSWHDLFAAYLASRRAGDPRRVLRGVLFTIRSLVLVAECYRLQASLRLGPAERDTAMFASLWRDVRIAARSLRRRPLFALVAVVTLALGIGANTALFSVVNAVLLRPLPYADAGRLVIVWGDNERATDRDPHSKDTFVDYADGLGAADHVAAITPSWSLTLRGNDAPERVRGNYATANFLPMLGVNPVLGRVFDADDDRVDAPATAMISTSLWQRRFGGATDVVGQELEMAEGNATIIGVLPAGFRWLEDVDVWLPVAHNEYWTSSGRQVRLFTIVAHLAPGATIQQLRSQANAIATRLANDYPDHQAGIDVRVVPLLDDIVGDVRPALLVLLGAVGLVLLIACANVANLMLVRSDGRRRETAVRAALGASRRRLAGEMLIESLLVSLLGGVAGFAIGAGGLRGLLAFIPVGIPRQNEIGLDAGMLLFALALGVVTGVVFGMAPALAAMRAHPGDSMKEGMRGSSVRRGRLRHLLVVGEVAIGLVVAVGASLLVRSFARLESVDPGFTVQHVLSMDLSGLPAPEERPGVMEALYERIDALPGVVAAGEVSRVPLAGQTNVTSSLDIESRPLPLTEQPEIDFRRASRDYFRAMGIEVLAGRAFERTDDGRGESVAVINRIAAERFFPGADPIGERVTLGGGTYQTIVGVVEAVHHEGLDADPRPEIYLHTLQGSLSNPHVVIRTTGDPLPIADAVRRVVHETRSDLVVSNLTTLQAVRDASLAGPRFNTLLFGLFALLAIALSAIGAWGVMAYTVTQRTREFGVRMSLGARPADVAGIVLKEGLVLACAGLTAGTIAALAATRLMRGLLFDVSPTDVPTFVVAFAGLLAIVLLASLASALRATRVDPVRALQSD
jgi:putative ABC transport system permease protein